MSLPPQPVAEPALEYRRAAPRRAGTLLLLAAAANVVMVATRVLADADQPTLAESVAAIAESRLLYGTTGAARLLSGVLLAGAAVFLWEAWASPSRRIPLAPILLAASGAITAASGVCAIMLAAAAPTAIDAATGAVDAPIETIEYLRWLTGNAGFAASGLGLAAVAIQRPRHGHPMARLPIVTLAIGLSMQLIWLDAATMLHRITGTAFFVWLLAHGVALVRRGEAPTSR